MALAMNVTAASIICLVNLRAVGITMCRLADMARAEKLPRSLCYPNMRHWNEPGALSALGNRSFLWFGYHFDTEL